MPLYSFLCNDCKKETEVDCPMDERNEPQYCTCGTLLERLFIPIKHIWNAAENEVGTVKRTRKRDDGKTVLK